MRSAAGGHEADAGDASGGAHHPRLVIPGRRSRSPAEFTRSRVTTSLERVGTMSEWMSGTDASSLGRRAGFGGHPSRRIVRSMRH
jgi:hypothetical protein